MKLSCCSLRRISRNKNVVFTIMPAMIKEKKMIPNPSSTPARQLRMIHPTLRATASATRPMPRQRKKTIVPRRLVMRMAQADFTAYREASLKHRGRRGSQSKHSGSQVYGVRACDPSAQDLMFVTQKAPTIEGQG